MTDGQIAMGRRPWLATTLSVLLPGLGQVYNGQVGKAAGFFFGFAVPIGISQRLGPVLWEAVLQGRDLSPNSEAFQMLFWLRGIVIALALAVWIWSVVDAKRTATRAAARK